MDNIDLFDELHENIIAIVATKCRNKNAEIGPQYNF